MIAAAARFALTCLTFTQMLAGSVSVAGLGDGLTPEPFPTQVLTLLVRDGTGGPLRGVALRVLAEGPPHEPFDTCVTDEAGTCTLLVPPGDYVVRFERGYGGRTFLPPERQNEGALDDGQTGGGFGVHFGPSSEEQLVAFVVGVQGEDTLYPLWDLSAGPDEPPQPFHPGTRLGQSPDEALAKAEIRFDALAEPAEPDEATPEPPPTLPQSQVEAEPTAQTLVTEVDVGGMAATTPTPDLPDTATPAPEMAAAGFSARTLTAGLLGALLFALLVAGVALFTRRKREG